MRERITSAQDSPTICLSKAARKVEELAFPGVDCVVPPRSSHGFPPVRWQDGKSSRTLCSPRACLPCFRR